MISMSDISGIFSNIWVTSVFNVCSWWAAIVVACPNVENFAMGVGKSLVMACSWWWVWDGASAVRIITACHRTKSVQNHLMTDHYT